MRAILDTFVFKNREIFLKKFHITRTFESYVSIEKSITENQVHAIYDQIEKEYSSEIGTDHLLRVIFNCESVQDFQVEVHPIPSLNSPVKLHLLKNVEPAAAEFKWADRSEWNALLLKKPAEIDDILIINQNNEIRETSRFNIFLYDKIASEVYTPPLTTGCLNGTYRRFALSTGSIELPEHGIKKLTEKVLKVSDLQFNEVFVANSVRGVQKAAVNAFLS